MAFIKLRGSVTQAYDKYIVVELDSESRTKLQNILDHLQDTTNVRTIYSTGAFRIGINQKTKILSATTCWDDMSDLVGYLVETTVRYRYYRFVNDGVISDGYTFIATHVRL